MSDVQVHEGALKRIEAIGLNGADYVAIFRQLAAQAHKLNAATCEATACYLDRDEQVADGAFIPSITLRVAKLEAYGG